MGKQFSVEGVITAVDKFSKPLASIGRKATNIGKGLTAGLSLPIVAIGAASIASSTELNKGMANVATLIPGNAKRIEELKKSVQDLSIETAQGTENMTAGLFETISAFSDTADTAEILRINALAATAGQATTLEAIKLTSAVTKGYGDSSAAAVQKAADLAFMTNKLGQTNFPELAASIGDAVPMAVELGVSQEELFGVMAAGTGPLGTASKVSTQLRGAMQALLAPSGELTKLFEDQEVASGKALIKQRGLHGALKFIASAAKQTGTPLQKFIGSVEGMQLSLALTGSLSDALTEKTKAMGSVSGSVSEAFVAQTEGVNKAGFQMAQLSAKVSVASQRLGDGLAPALLAIFERVSPLIDGVISLATQFSELDAGSQGTIIAIAAIAAALGPVLVVVGAVTSAIAAIGLPVAAAIAGFTALAAAGAAIYANWNPVQGVFENLENIYDGVKGFLGFGEPAQPGQPGTGGGGLKASPGGSALPQAQQVGGEIRVKFEGAPAGTRVEAQPAGNAGVGLTTDVGTSLSDFFGF